MSLEMIQLKVESLGDDIKQSVDLCRQTLEEIKRMNDINAFHVESLKEEDQRIRDELGEHKKIHAVIFAQLDKLNDAMTKEHGYARKHNGIDPDSFNAHASKWIHSKIALGVFWAISLAAAVIVTHAIDRWLVY